MATKLTGKNWPGDKRSKYPWDEWLDGSVWQITPGKDFTCTAEHFRRQCYVIAIRRGGKARTSASNGHLILQFVKDGA